MQQEEEKGSRRKGGEVALRAKLQKGTVWETRPVYELIRASEEQKAMTQQESSPGSQSGIEGGESRVSREAFVKARAVCQETGLYGSEGRGGGNLTSLPDFADRI